MKKYSKVIDGETVIRNKHQIEIISNGVAMYGLPETVILEHGWSIYEEDIEELRDNLIKDVKLYDTSENVNVFYLNNKAMWLSKDVRVGLKLRFESELKNDCPTTTLWYDNQLYVLDINLAIQMLYNIELYASKCYDITQYHIKTISELQTIEEIKNYDITQSYPEKLYFNN